jgi:hypothetical protein
MSRQSIAEWWKGSCQKCIEAGFRHTKGENYKSKITFVDESEMHCNVLQDKSCDKKIVFVLNGIRFTALKDFVKGVSCV